MKVNPLELTKKQVLIASGLAVAIGLAFIFCIGYTAIANTKDVMQRQVYDTPGGKVTETVPAVQPEQTPSQASIAPSSAAPTRTTTNPTSKPKAATAPTTAPQAATPKAETPKMANCPAGYYAIGTDACHKEPSGCPFYEDDSIKGCVPPSDIKCSDATFTNCWHVGN